MRNERSPDTSEIDRLFEELKYTDDKIINFFIVKSYSVNCDNGDRGVSFVALNHKLYSIALDSLKKYVNFREPDLVKYERRFIAYIDELMMKRNHSDITRKLYNDYFNEVEVRARIKCIALMKIIKDNNDKHYKQYNNIYQRALKRAQEIQSLRLHNMYVAHPSLKSIKALVKNHNFHLHSVHEGSISDSTKIQLWCSVAEAEELLLFINTYPQHEETFWDCDTTSSINERASTSTYLEKTYAEWWEIFKSNRLPPKKKKDEQQVTLLQDQRSVRNAIDVESLAKKAYRTKSKTKALVPDITEEELNDKEESMVKNYFPMKYNKRFMVHHLAPPGTFQMDLFFSGPYVYLLAINSASRKVFAICTNQYGLNPKSTPQLIKALKDLMKVTAVRNIEMDGESAMYSNDMQLFLNANGITLRKCNDGHTQLALVDRFCRTLRDIFNNITNGEYYNQPTGQTASSGNVITPEVMNAIVEIYNNAPHDTLNKVIRYRVVGEDGTRYSLTPNLVDSIPELQNIYYKNMMSMNYLQMTQDGYELPVGTLVSVYNERNSYMDKRRTVIRPKLYRVVERVGGMYKCVNVNDDTDVVITSRIKLSPAIGKLKFKDFN